VGAQGPIIGGAGVNYRGLRCPFLKGQVPSTGRSGAHYRGPGAHHRGFRCSSFPRLIPGLARGLLSAMCLPRHPPHPKLSSKTLYVFSTTTIFLKRVLR
jgi:hypothetical protein